MPGTPIFWPLAGVHEAPSPPRLSCREENRSSRWVCPVHRASPRRCSKYCSIGWRWGDPWPKLLAIPGFTFSFLMSLMRRTRWRPNSLFPAALGEGLRQRGWQVVLPEGSGRGRYFGGINAVEFNSDGTLTGFADPPAHQRGGRILRAAPAAAGAPASESLEGTNREPRRRRAIIPLPTCWPISVFVRSFHAKDQEVRCQAVQIIRHRQANASHAWLPSPSGREKHEAKASCLS